MSVASLACKWCRGYTLSPSGTNSANLASGGGRVTSGLADLKADAKDEA